MGQEYCIQPGDDFHKLAQRWGGNCLDYLQANPSIDPLKLQIGQIIVLPEFRTTSKGQEQYVDIHGNHSQEFVGDYLDEVEMEVEGVRFRLRRIGEPKVPHEIHFILPRTEIHKVQPMGEGGPTDVQIILSNFDVVLSPRLVSGKGDSAKQPLQGPQTHNAQRQAAPEYGQKAETTLESSQDSRPVINKADSKMSFPFKSST